MFIKLTTRDNEPAYVRSSEVNNIVQKGVFTAIYCKGDSSPLHVLEKAPDVICKVETTPQDGKHN